ncbi:amino acid adenylation domain-containing protein [Paenibacillus tritici]|uniref:Amino acid adenylation domain-containing protein n=1 Tax=Paenibacillus tritici TaxID=1873425 RepID=A0ABX2DQF5_9BACL|nr:non-ribosomal peptide synthetase [Paenibacillus tritici]NQX46096.1 amino acid adenylation domain-containing protein [Paenibacillus tritici]
MSITKHDSLLTNNGVESAARLLPTQSVQKFRGICKNKSSRNVFLTTVSMVVLDKYDLLTDEGICQPVTNTSDKLYDSLLELKMPEQLDIPFAELLFRVKDGFEQHYLKELEKCDGIPIIYLAGYNDIALNNIRCPNLNLCFEEIDDDLFIHINYATILYRPEIIGFILESFEAIFTVICDNPKVMLNELNTVWEEQMTMLSIFNRTEAVEEKKLLIEQFVDIVQWKPQETALIFEDVKYSYKELNEAADRFASYLSDRGVQCGEIIPILLPRSEKFIISMLAVLKLGCAYLPLDVDFPEERITYILRNSRAKHIVSDFESDHIKEMSVIRFDFGIQAFEAKSFPPVSAGNLAYVIYTSGSTGNPKGVCISNKAVSNFIHAIVSDMHLKENMNILSLTTVSFDIFVLESLLPLLSGMTLVLAASEDGRDPSRICSLIDKYKVHLIQTTPTRMKSLINDSNFTDIIRKLDYVLIGGEPVSAQLINDVQYYTAAQIFNMYGPTETTVWSTMKKVDNRTKVNIGKPIANTKVMILDSYNKVVPIGAEGEICISGSGLFNGYLYNEALSDSKIVHLKNNHFEDDFYRTGDMGRWGIDGEIECFGRMDNQVKVRGYRIELEEIEEALRTYEEIMDAVVTTSDMTSGEIYLKAYLVGSTQLRANEVIAYISRILPKYMIPSSYYQIESVPLTPNLKIDRKALKGDIQKQLLYSDPVDEPKNEIESLLLDAWKEELGTESIGLDDNFFAIGGTSLKAIQLTTNLFSNFEISGNLLFEYPTIRQLAAQVKYRKENLTDYLFTQREYAHQLLTSWTSEQPLYSAQMQEYKEKISVFKQTHSLNTSIKYKNILLTGSTGYFGLHLLNRLIQEDAQEIYVLIRPRDGMTNQERLDQKYAYYFQDEPPVSSFANVHIVSGDITLDDLGMDEQTYSGFTQSIDCVIHAAALVSHYGSYNNFFMNNVQGTSNMVKFAQQGKQKFICYISTQGMGTKLKSPLQREIFTEFDVIAEVEADNYYLQTKAEAENLVREAGSPYMIFRLGTLFTNSGTKVIPHNYKSLAAYKVLNAFKSLEMIPDLPVPVQDFSFVNHVVDAFLKLYNIRDLKNQTLHLSSSVPVLMPDLGGIIRAQQTKIEMLGIQDFFDEIHQRYLKKEKISSITDLLAFFHVSKFFTDRENLFTSILLDHLNFKWETLDKDNFTI